MAGRVHRSRSSHPRAGLRRAYHPPVILCVSSTRLHRRVHLRPRARSPSPCGRRRHRSSRHVLRSERTHWPATAVLELPEELEKPFLKPARKRWAERSGGLDVEGAVDVRLLGLVRAVLAPIPKWQSSSPQADGAAPRRSKSHSISHLKRATEYLCSRLPICS